MLLFLSSDWRHYNLLVFVGVWSMVQSLWQQHECMIVLSYAICSQCQVNQHLFITQELAADVAVGDRAISKHIPGPPLHPARLNQWYERTAYIYSYLGITRLILLTMIRLSKDVKSVILYQGGVRPINLGSQ